MAKHLYHTNQGLSNIIKPCYNQCMPRDHFARMYRNPSHRHDQEHDSIQFEKAVGALCGMLYSVVTLKAFFPPRPKSADDQPEKKITKA